MGLDREGGRVRAAVPRILLAAVVATALVALVAAPAGAQVSGAIFTTDAGCGGVNINIFDDKDDVYLNGGPTGGAPGLPNGFYYVQVTDPSTDAVLGKTNDPVVQVSSGQFVDCYQLSAILLSAGSGFTTPGYNNTPNPGGVYKVTISQDATFPPAASKSDNFKVVSSDGPPPPGLARLMVDKFYDANANGAEDSGEVRIAGWLVDIVNGISFTGPTPVDVPLDPGAYTVSERQPIEANWLPTTSTSVPVTLDPGETEAVLFGNVCIGPGGGHTLGFWSNKNGQKLVGGDDLAQLVALNLRNADGSHFNPGTYGALRTWLLNANATNMAYMLSAQLAAMALNVHNGLVSGSALVYAPGVIDGSDFITVQQLIDAANDELFVNGLVLSGHAARPDQEVIKNALDAANNNRIFVQAAPCAFTFGP